MPRKLPLCAWCGKSLQGHGQLRLTYDDLPGRPEIGWHEWEPHGIICFQKDPWSQLVRSEADPEGLPKDKIIAALRMIEKRGPGRVVANKGWPAPEGSGAE